ncbi:MAG: phosphoribosylglycinamide synthetase C domain-containing protein, partial [Candidatus Acidiferrales bacterium]
LGRVNDCAIFHAGTRKEADKYYVSSGRVLNIAASASSIAEARSKVYDAAKGISFEGMHYRRDIGREIEGPRTADRSRTNNKGLRA